MKFSFLIVLNTFFSSLCFAQDFPLIGMTQNAPPLLYENENENGKLIGDYSDKFYHILAVAQINPSIQVYPWARTYELAKKRKNTLIFPIAKTPEREKYFIFLGVLYESKTYFYKNKKNTTIKINSLEDAKKYKICTVRKDIKHEFLLKNDFKNILEYAEIEDTVKALEQSKCDLSIGTVTFSYIYNKVTKKNSEINIAFEIKELADGRYIAIQNDSDLNIISNLKNALNIVNNEYKNK